MIRPGGKQQGYTLIGTMVGMLISLLTIAAMLAVYQTSTHVTRDAVAGNQRDGQLSSALLAAQIELQQAGFGLDPSLDNVRVSADGDWLAWRYMPFLGAAAAECSYLQIETADEGSGKRVKLWVAKAPIASCATTSSVSPETIAEEEKQLLASYSTLAEADDDIGGLRLYDKSSNTAATFSGPTPSVCRLPYNQQPADAAYPDAPSVSMTLGGQTLFTACLSNLGTITGGAAGSSADNDEGLQNNG